MEKELQLTIFNRYRTGAVPTEAGLQVIQHAKNILNEITEIHNLTEGDISNISGIIKIGTIPTLGTILLPRVIMEFHTNFPNVQVKIQECGTTEILEKCFKEDIDIGLVSAHGKISFADKMRFYKLFEGKLTAYVGNKSILKDRKKVSFRDLASFPLFLYSNQFNLHKYCLEEISKYGQPDVISTTHNPEMIKKVVMETTSVGFGPDISLQNDIYFKHKLLHMLEITDAVPVDFGMVLLKGKKYNKLLNRMKEAITRAAGDL